MCGINGFNFADAQLIQQMNRIVKHRGPDDDGVFVDDGVSLGNVRLAVLDLSPLGHQPMFSRDDRYVLVYNGEIYNFQEIRRTMEVRGHVFQSQSDSEVILAAYQEYGADCLQKFNGMFAFAIWDRRERALFLARDRVGVKPLYYYYDNHQRFIFSSEIKAILQHAVPRTLDRQAFNIYWRMLYVPAPLTMFKEIKKLAPGSYLVVKDGAVSVAEYWQPDNFSDLTDRAEAESAIRTLLKDSVRLRLISDRPVGIFLSGGIDSTIITGLVSERAKSTVKTFSVAYDVAPEKFNADAALARRTAAHYHTDHHEFLVTGKDAAQYIEPVIYHLDEPVANATQIATYLLSKYSREQVVVALGGDGGDELFGGYERYRLSRFITRYQRLPAFLRARVGEPLLSMVKEKRPSLAKLNLPAGVSRYLAFMAQKEAEVSRVLRPEANDPLVTEKFYRDHYFTSLKGAGLTAGPSDPEKQLMLADVRSWLVDESLMRTDKMTMAWGLEQRVPILDYRLVELSLRIPTRWKIKGGQGKHILRAAMKDYLPPHVLSEPKRGWFSPTSAWFRGELKSLTYEVLSPSYNEGLGELFDFDSIRTMLTDHIELRAYHMNLLWAMVTFQIWWRKFMA